MNGLQKRECLEIVLENIMADEKSEDVQKKIMELLLADTNNGKVYKYRSFNAHALSNLKDNTLYCAIPSSFNDPFDCKMGIDLQSFIDARFGSEFKCIEEYLTKFSQIYNEQLTMGACTDREKIVFEKWLNNKRLYEFVEKCQNIDKTSGKLEEVLVNNFDIIAELFMDITMDSGLKTQIGYASEEFPRILNKLTEEACMKVINGNLTFVDWAKYFGVDEDVDEISLMMIMCQLQTPEKAEDIKRVDEDLAEANRKLAEDIDRQYRVGSLCTDYKNRLMWSHYADGHKGFCVEYDFSMTDDNLNGFFILPVVYSKERIKIPWDAAFEENKDNEKIKKEAAKTMLRSLLIKDEVWRYENEWRVIISGICKNENIKMPPVSCIYIGALCSDEHKEILARIGKELNIPVKQMIVDRGEYMLHAKECETIIES